MPGPNNSERLYKQVLSILTGKEFKDPPKAMSAEEGDRYEQMKALDQPAKAERPRSLEDEERAYHQNTVDGERALRKLLARSGEGNQLSDMDMAMPGSSEDNEDPYLRAMDRAGERYRKRTGQ